MLFEKALLKFTVLAFRSVPLTVNPESNIGYSNMIYHGSRRGQCV